jgi:propionate catabolism operon transcriptional regulator
VRARPARPRHRTIVGPGLVTDLAASAGMGAVFLYSHASVRQAVETALEVAYATHAEAFRRQRLDNLLQHLRDGVVALDARGRVEAINERLASALESNPRPSAARSSISGRSCARYAAKTAMRSRPCAA